MKGNKLSSHRGKQGTGMRRIKDGCMGVPVWGRNVIKLKDVSEEILHEHATHRAIRHARASVGLHTAIMHGKEAYAQYIEQLRASLYAGFYAHVMEQVGEKFWIEYTDRRFAWTLYQYDLAGNLITTVPPEGVHPLEGDALGDVNPLRAANIFSPAQVPQHTKTSSYEFSTANQVLRERTPDGGLKDMYYDAKGNLILTQNANQRPLGAFTYMLYDRQNRLVETGEVKWTNCAGFDDVPLTIYNSSGLPVGTAQPNDCACQNLEAGVWTYCLPFLDMNSYDNEVFATVIRSKPRTQVVATIYDHEFTNLGAIPGQQRQQRLRGRVAASMYYDNCPPGVPAGGYKHATHYSYDAAGNVSTLVQEFPELAGMKQQYKRIDYEYDLHSGKVNMLAYNRSFADQFYQRYTYDADNRITSVETSHDGFIWKRDAGYTYYQHGPLARVSFGDLRIQGLDYAYTLQGWLRSINASATDSLLDMGRDGDPAVSTIVPIDLYAMELNYFNNDYQSISGITFSGVPHQTKNLYNGNIARQTTALGEYSIEPLTTDYTYDQMNRLREARYNLLRGDGTLASIPSFASTYKYDLDGNIKELTRSNEGGMLMDSLKYHYQDPVHNNKLHQIIDHAAFAEPGYTDKRNTTQYIFDNIGQLTVDGSSTSEAATWNIYGKLRSVGVLGHPDVGIPYPLNFTYDAAGNRVIKRATITLRNDTTNEQTEYYVRDAAGNILAEYRAEKLWVPNGKIKFWELAYDDFSVTHFPGLSGSKTQVWLQLLGSEELSYLQTQDVAAEIISHVGTEDIPTEDVGFYVSRDAELLLKLIENGNEPLAALMRYSATQGKYPLGDALVRDVISSNGSTLDILTLALLQHPDSARRANAIRLWCALLPSGAEAVAADLRVNISDTDSLYQALEAVLKQQPKYLADQTKELYRQGVEVLRPWIAIATLDSTLLGTNWDYDTRYSELLRNVLLSKSERVAQDEALAAGSQKISNYGIYAFATWWPGTIAVLGDALNPENRRTISYYDNPVAFLDAYIGGNEARLSVLFEALAKNNDIDVAYAADVLKLSSVISIDSWLSDKPILKRQQIELASHHIYGSARLGLSQYWPLQYGALWNYGSSITDTARLLGRQPWYSGVLNAVMERDSVQPWDGGLLNRTYTQHLVGQKMYELTSHLGNVQAVVSDQRYVKVNEDGSRLFRAVAPAYYDYYPFGQLIKERSIQDTSYQSMTATQIVNVPNIVTTPLPLTGWSGLYGATISYSGGVIASGTQGGMSRSLGGLVPGVMATVTVNMRYVRKLPFSISVVDDASGTVVANQNITSGPLVPYSLSFIPTGNNVTLRIEEGVGFTSSGTLLHLASGTYTQQQGWTTAPLAVQLSNKDADKYKFGFNGQEKVNEIAGVGNSIYYKAREYDPRIARFKSVDPLTKKYPWYSPYQFAGNTPIQAIDLDGLEEYYTRGGELIGKYGTSTEVRIVYDDMIDRARGVTGASGTSRMGNELNNDLYKNGSAPIFNSTENAAKGWASRFNTKSINEKKEYNSYIFSTKINGKVVGSYTRPEIGMKKETRTKWSPMGLSKYHAHIHSHGDNDVDYNNESFSEEDIDLYKQIGILGYLTTPKGKLKSYNPNNAANKREKVILDKISPDKEMNVQEKEPISQYPLNGDAK